MNKSVCVVGKSSSLLSKNLANIIDNHDIVIRANNIPDDINYKKIGKKTDIFSTRSLIKFINFIDKIENEKIWVCSNNIEHYNYERLKHIYKYLKVNLEIYRKLYNTFRFISEEEISLLKKDYQNKLQNRCNNHDDKKYGFCIPDTGMTTISLALMRFPDYEINVCGFDLYDKGNTNIYTSNKNFSIFKTPVLQELLIFKKLIKSSRINLL